MLDAMIFGGIVALVAILLSPILVRYSIDPWVIFAIATIVLLPGFYGALTGGPFVPTPSKRRDSMLKLAKIKAGETVYDLGCGDGRLVFAAGALGARATGFELSIPLVLWGKIQALFGKKGRVCHGDLWRQDYSKADVIFCYLLPRTMKKFEHKIWPTLKKGARVVSNGFSMPGIWEKKIEEHVYLYVK
ncbi:class I SAM-dependent methyltransferase [Candidatus Peregrinibacteria bacterium]|nr:class I SAM-dependent methyltransferase [Candidatus Peregrinibacteria bacterium]